MYTYAVHRGGLYSYNIIFLIFLQFIIYFYYKVQCPDINFLININLHYIMFNADLLTWIYFLPDTYYIIGFFHIIFIYRTSSCNFNCKTFFIINY